jgi:hypothetical protein
MTNQDRTALSGALIQAMPRPTTDVLRLYTSARMNRNASMSDLGAVAVEARRSSN